MKHLRNVNALSLEEAVNAAAQARQNGETSAYSGGGTDLLQQLKDGTDTSDVLINLRNVQGSRQLNTHSSGTEIGALITLEELAASDVAAVLQQAAASVATPQIRNVATLGGNLNQRPWCWYYRNGFNCFKAGGSECFSVNGENQQHAIFGGGPSFIVHPSDLAPALVALDAQITIAGPTGERNIAAADFFTLPSINPERENVLVADELITAISLPPAEENLISHYHKVMDREAWTHAEVSVAAAIVLNGDMVESASLVLGGVATIPWRLPEVETYLLGRQLTDAVITMAGQLAVQNAAPLSKNAHKIPMTSAAVERCLQALVTG